MSSIVNASPQTEAYGIQDKSGRAPVVEPMALPSHLPKIYGFAQTGPVDPQLVGGSSRNRVYGEKTFDEREKFCTHQTILANKVMATGNQCMFERVVPTDAAPPAGYRMYADVLETQLPQYERNEDGSFVRDTDGNRVVMPGAKIPGFKVKFVVAAIAAPVFNSDATSPDDDFGLGTILPGDQVDDATSIQSKRYPLWDAAVPHQGSDGNNQGMRFWAPTQISSNPVKEYLIKAGAYPVRVACVRRHDENSTPKIVETEFAEQFVNVVFKPAMIDKSMDQEVYIGDVLLDQYRDMNPQDGSPKKYGPFGRFKVYEQNIARLLKDFYDAEFSKIDPAFSDFDGSEEEFWRFNFIGGQSSFGYNYDSYEVVTGVDDAVRLTENSTIYAIGGSDGTMNRDVFSELVAERVREYANENSILQSDALNPESIIYDSGFSMTTKKALASFISIRKDTAIALSTHIAGEPQLSASEDSSRAMMLKAFVDSFPESEYYNTSVVRAIIVGRSGKLINSAYRDFLPITIEIAAKAADYMGAGNGVWKPERAFDEGDLRRITMFKDVNVTFTPAKVRNKDWSNGMIWVEAYDLISNYIPAMKTVFKDDTSVLTSFFTMMACVELQKVGYRTHRAFSGNAKLTRIQLAERVEDKVTELVKDRFDSRFIIVPEVFFTKADNQRGFSWSLRIRIGAPNMMTVQQLTIEANRIDDMAEAA